MNLPSLNFAFPAIITTILFPGSLFLSSLFLGSVFLGSVFLSSGVLSADDVSASLEYQRAVAKQVRKIAEEVLPSVVSIEAIGALQSDGEVRQDAPTSGIVIDREGYVLASSWVTRGPSASIIVTITGGQRFPARLIAEDKHRELVLLKIDPKETELPVVGLGKGATETPAGAPTDAAATSLPIGSTTIALARYGESNVPMVSTGILSAVERLDGTAVQCDARISPVFYGGPLLDLRGNLIGVLIPAVGENGAEDPTEWYDSGIAFAIPSETIAKNLARLKNGETIRAGLLGLVVGGSDPYAPGTTLATVRKRSPADRAGLQTGDRLLRVGGREVRRRQEVKLALGPFDAGDELAIEYEREGETRTTRATLAETIEPLRPQYLGITSSGGRVTSLLPGSPADGVLQVGDGLRSLDGSLIQDEQTLRQRLWSADPATPIQVQWQRESENEKPMQGDVTPAPWAGPLDRFALTKWHETQTVDSATEEAWEQTTVRLPDVTNEALLWSPSAIAKEQDAETKSVKSEPNSEADSGPKKDDDTPAVENPAAETVPVALLVILVPPSQRDLPEQMKAWEKLARKYRVAICLIASDDPQRWQLSEIDAIGKLALAAIKQSGADADAVSVASFGALSGQAEEAIQASGPADSMVLAVSLSTDNLFHGVALPTNTRPPAIRLRPDAAMRLLRVLMATTPDSELPSWSETLTRLGCPLQTSEELDREQLLLWCRSLLIY